MGKTFQLRNGKFAFVLHNHCITANHEKKIDFSFAHEGQKCANFFVHVLKKKIAAFADLVESRARENFVPRHLTHYLSISIWPASSKAKKAFGRLYRCVFFFIFVRILLRKNTKAQKAASIICIQSVLFCFVLFFF